MSEIPQVYKNIDKRKKSQLYNFSRQTDRPIMQSRLRRARRRLAEFYREMSFLQELEHFKSDNLKSVQTTVTTAEGRKFVEYKSDDGNQITLDTGERCFGFCEDLTPDEKVNKVVDKLFISSQDAAHNLEELKTNNITHILNVGTGIENAFPEEFQYKTVELLDLPNTQISHHFTKMFQFIGDGFKKGAVLVHCNAGVSRSATVVLAYLMFSRGLLLEEAMCIVKEARPCVKPNEGFLQQLHNYEKDLRLHKNVAGISLHAKTDRN